MSSTITGRRRRSAKILRLFFSLVFDFLLQYARARLAGRSYDFFGDSRHNRKRAIAIRTSALQMGGVLIKVGQFLSSRVDLLPTEYIEELALLQDEVPGVPFPEIQAVVESELGCSLDVGFAEFQRAPLAAASLGQVHRARLPTGENVAVKVQRPNIGKLVRADLESLRYIVHWLDRHTAVGKRADLPQIMHEFEETLVLELDYVREGHHAERLAVEFSHVDSIAIPRIYWSHSTNRVLTMQYMEGAKVTEFADLERQGISRSRVAEILMWAYLRQILEIGFFHADPHPGNIFVQPGPIIVFLDFGMVGDLPPQVRENIRQVFLGVIRRDFDAVLSALDRLGFLARDADRVALKRVLVWTIDNFYELSFGELRSVDPRRVLDHLQDVLYTESFHIPANFGFLGRALGTLSGLCTALDPSFQFVSVAEPFGRDLLQQKRGVRGAIDNVVTEAKALASTAYTLPHLSRDVLIRVQGGELDFRRELDEVSRAVDRLERGMRKILYAMLLTGFLVAGTFVFPTHFRALSIVAFFIALILLVFVIAPFQRRR